MPRKADPGLEPIFCGWHRPNRSSPWMRVLSARGEKFACRALILAGLVGELAVRPEGELPDESNR